MSGYVHCGCRDCIETAIGEPGDMCWECKEAGCEPGSECQVERDLEDDSDEPEPAGNRRDREDFHSDG
jgi:hypothetical protein